MKHSDNIKTDLSLYSKVNFNGINLIADSLQIKDGYLSFTNGLNTIAYKEIPDNLYITVCFHYGNVVVQFKKRAELLPEELEALNQKYNFKWKKYIPWEYKFKVDIVPKVIGLVSKKNKTLFKRMDKRLEEGHRCRNYSWV
jgi:hypothetical protein